MGMSRIEVNLKRFLLQCENQAKENSQPDWRLGKYIGALDDMVADLQKLPNKPAKETMLEYTTRISFLRGLVETSKLPTTEEKAVASQLLSHGSSISSDSLMKEIRQKTTSKYKQEMRDQLFDSDKTTEDSLRQRLKQQPSGEDLDVLLKYHHSMQEKIADDMLLLARSLKEQSKLANTIIKKDTETVEKSSHLADKNFAQLKLESEKLEEHSRRAWKCWMWIMIAIVIIIFVNMVLFMRVMKKKV